MASAFSHDRRRSDISIIHETLQACGVKKKRTWIDELPSNACIHPPAGSRHPKPLISLSLTWFLIFDLASIPAGRRAMHCWAHGDEPE